MPRLSSGATRGSKKDNFIRSYDNPEDLKEAIFSHLIANNINDYEDMTAEDLAYALNVRAQHIEPLLDAVKKDVSESIDDYELYASMRPEMTDAEMEAMAQDFARAQTVTDRFADMTPEEAADYAAYMDEETWRDRLSSGAKGNTSEERISNFYNDMAEQTTAFTQDLANGDARLFGDMSDTEQLTVFNGIKERLSDNNPSMVGVLEDGGLDIDGYLQEFPQLHPDSPSSGNQRLSSGHGSRPRGKTVKYGFVEDKSPRHIKKDGKWVQVDDGQKLFVDIYDRFEGGRDQRITIDELRDENGIPNGKFALGRLVWDDYEGYYDDEPDWDIGGELSDEDFDSIDSAMEFARDWARERGQFFGASNEEMDDPFWWDSSVTPETARAAWDADFERYMARRDAESEAWRAANPDGDRFSSGRSIARRQGSGKNSRARGQRPWSDEDRQNFADGNKLRAQTVPGKRRQGPSVDEFSSDERLSSGINNFNRYNIATPEGWKMPEIGDDGEIKDGPLKGFYIRPDIDSWRNLVPGRKYVKYNGRGQYQESDEFKGTVVDWAEGTELYELGHTLDRNIESDEDVMGIFGSSEQETMAQYGEEGIFQGNSSRGIYNDPQNDYETPVEDDEHSPEDGTAHIGKVVSVADGGENKLYGIIVDGNAPEYEEFERDEDYPGGTGVSTDGGLVVLATHDADGKKLDKPIIVEGTFGIEGHQVTNASDGLDLFGPRISVSKSEVTEDTFNEAQKLYKELDPFKNGKADAFDREALILSREYRNAGKEKNRLSSGARFAPEGESGSRLQRRLSSGEVKGPPPTGSDKYNREEQVGATMRTYHSDPSTAIIPSEATGILGDVPSGKESHVLNTAAAEKIIANPDMEYSADNGWPVDAGKLLDFIEVDDDDAIRTLREIGDAQRIATILGIPESSAKDMLDGKPVYIGSGTAADMFDKLSRNKQYDQSVGGLNDVARVWGFDGAPKWVRHSDVATPEFDLDENDMVTWSDVKWEGLSRAEFDAEVKRGKNPPEPVYTSPVEFFNGDAVASNPKWDARAGSFKNPTVDSEFIATPKKLSRSEQLEPTRMPSQARVGQTTARADKEFAKEWIKRAHGVSAANMMDILGIQRDSEGENVTNAEVKKLLVALNEIREKAGLKTIGNDGVFRDQTVVDAKRMAIPDEVMHALITSGKFKNMKEALASLGDPRLDSLAAEYDSRMLVDAALIRIKDKMNKDGVAGASKIITDAMTTAFGRNPDKQKRVIEGRVSIAGDMKEDGMIGDDKISEVLGLVNEKLTQAGYPEISQDELFPKDEAGGYVNNFSSAVPGSPRMSSGQRFIARSSSSRRADAMNDATARREGNVARLSSGNIQSMPAFRDADGKLSPTNMRDAAVSATIPEGVRIRKTPGQNIEDFEKAVKTRAEIAETLNVDTSAINGFSVYDLEDEMKKAGIPEDEAAELVDKLVELDDYIDAIEEKFSEAEDVMDAAIEEAEDALDKIAKLRKERADVIKRYGEEDGQPLVEAIDEKISKATKKLDDAYQMGIGNEDARMGTLYSQVDEILSNNRGWSKRSPSSYRNSTNENLTALEAAITKAGGVKKAVPVTGIDFGVPEGTRLSSGKADEYYQNLTSHLINMIEKSQKEGGKWDAPWHRAGNLPRNASTKNMYSGGNLFALMLAAEEKGYTTPQWAGFQQWKKLGGSVKKGEKATIILIPRQMFGEEIDDNGVKVRKSKGTFFSTAHVFNFDQIEGIDREEFLKAPADALTPEQRVGKLEDAIKEIGATINTGDGSRAYYSPREDHIVMPPFELFKSPEGYYGTLAHELVHWTGHSSRLDRKNMNQFGSPDYAREELVAEFGSAFLLAMFDLSAEPREDHAHYLASWLKVLREEPNALQEASIKAQAASNMLIAQMQAVLKEMGLTASDAESAVDVKSLQIFNDPLYEVKDAYIEWSSDPFNAPFLVKSLDDKKHSSGLVNRSWERIAETAIFLERLSRRKK
jgi:antirestriction protein ArdC